VGDVGRPDLSSGNLSKEELAAILYDTLQQKIITLPDEVLVYPAHGAGSSCGKNLGPETTSTIREQKLTNYALQPQSKEEFVNNLTKDLDAPPQYFPINARINKEGYDSLDEILKKGLTPLSVEAFKAKMKQDEVTVLDTRRATTFTRGFIPGSVSIGLEGRFAEWAGVILSFEKPILLVAEKGLEKEAVVRLARVGFSSIEGFLKGGFDAWQKEGEKIDMIVDVETDELAMDIPYDDNLVVVDVRRETEFGDGHISNAINIPLDELTDPLNLASFEDNQNIYIHCATGYRSVIASSLFKKQGIHNIRNVLGGYDQIKKLEKIQISKENSVLN
jgi:rhodanese-related sulfurtransferase